MYVVRSGECSFGYPVAYTAVNVSIIRVFSFTQNDVNISMLISSFMILSILYASGFDVAIDFPE